MMRYHSNTNSAPISFALSVQNPFDLNGIVFLSSFLFLQRDEKQGSERPRFQRSEFVHRLVTGMFSGFSTSIFLLQFFKGRERNLLLQGFSGLIVNIC